MSERSRGSATYDDVLSAPEDKVAEIVGGDLYLSPRPASRHARATSVLLGTLSPAFDFGTKGPGGWWLVTEPEIHFGAHILVPDLAGWKRERMPEFPDVTFFEVAPDWLCEVISPSTESLDRLRKLPIYAQASTRYVWLIDPVKKILEVYRLENGQYVCEAAHAGSAAVRVEPFEAVPLELASLWI